MTAPTRRRLVNPGAFSSTMVCRLSPVGHQGPGVPPHGASQASDLAVPDGPLAAGPCGVPAAAALPKHGIGRRRTSDIPLGVLPAKWQRAKSVGLSGPVAQAVRRRDQPPEVPLTGRIRRPPSGATGVLQNRRSPGVWLVEERLHAHMTELHEDRPGCSGWSEPQRGVDRDHGHRPARGARPRSCIHHIDPGR